MKKAMFFRVVALSFLLLFTVSTHAFALQYLHPEVYDVNKYVNSGVPIPAGVDPHDTSDSLLCWAAAASNVLMYTDWGFDRDLDGIVEPYDDLYHFYLQAFPNAGGSGAAAYGSYVPVHWGATLAAGGETWDDFFVTYTSHSAV